MMIELVRRRALAPDARLSALLGATAFGSFGWLLLHDQVHPLVVYLLQVYLAF